MASKQTRRQWQKKRAQELKMAKVKEAERRLKGLKVATTGDMLEAVQRVR